MDIDSVLDAVELFVIWLTTAFLTLVWSFLPAAAIVGASQHFRLRSPAFFIGASCTASLIVAGLVAELIWSPDVPPQDPEYLGYHDLLLRLVGIFVPGGFVGGLTYWFIACRNVAKPTAD